MNTSIIKRSARAAIAALALAAAAAAQAPAAAVTLAPAYHPGARLDYAIAIHSAIGTQATLDTAAEAEVHILAGAAPGSFTADVRFTRFKTTVQAQDASDRAGLEQQAAATDQAAAAMKPVRFQVSGRDLHILARPPGADYDQPVEMLEELMRTDQLPAGPVAVGSHWTGERAQPIPTMNASVALRLDCALTSLGDTGGVPTATLTVHSEGRSDLPPNALPGAAELAKQGLMATASITFDTDSTSIYRRADAVLLKTTSDTHNTMVLKLVGPSPLARTTDTHIDSTATVTLERETGGT